MTCIPYVMISYSKDGGETWSSEIKRQLVNCTKNYLNKVIIGPLPAAHQLVFRVKCSENISFTLVSAHAVMEMGP